MDIDIDLKTDFDPTRVIPNCIKASMINNGKFVPHTCGAYISNIPRDPISGISAIPYDLAEDLGFMKIDFLHLQLLDNFESRDEIKALMNMDPNWDLLKSPKVVSALFQLGKQWDVVSAIEPRSVQELADTLAMTKPAKRFLIDLYKRDPSAARKELYKKDDNSYAYKKAHAFAYAFNVILQLHLIEHGIIEV